MLNDTINDNKRKYKNKLGYIDPTVAGIDIGAENIYVSIPNEEHGSIVVVFGATTPELRKIVDALKKASVITAVMEATGVYWIPLYEILEEAGIQPVLVDAKSVKNVPEEKQMCKTVSGSKCSTLTVWCVLHIVRREIV